MKPAISVRNLTKEFTYWSEAPTTLKSALVDLLRGRFSTATHQRFTALEDISFEIMPGEFVGILGRNGAGKSTILKVISGIYSPNLGSVALNGQIAPMIELGAGFHPDLSGYENIFLNSAILGYGRNVTLGILEKVIEFAELGEKIHMPVKNYSTGMVVRLGFSIVVHLPAPILLMDEVLAVGDVAFQAKCLEKIGELHKEGRTIVLVTHDIASVKQHCTRCIVIAERKKIYDGPPTDGLKLLIDSIA